MSTKIVVPVDGTNGFINGAVVSAWLVSRFAYSTVPTQGTAAPSGSPDNVEGYVTTATGGAPGQAVLTLPTSTASYNILTTYAGVNYWTQAPGIDQASLILSESQITGLVADLAVARAYLASPAFTGAPTAPTAAALTSSVQVATTAYADLAVAAGTAIGKARSALQASYGHAYASAHQVVTTTHSMTTGTTLTSLVGGALNVGSTTYDGTPAPATGNLAIITSGGVAVLSYTGITSTSFTGIAIVSGTGSWTLTNGQNVNTTIQSAVTAATSTVPGTTDPWPTFRRAILVPPSINAAGGFSTTNSMTTGTALSALAGTLNVAATAGAAPASANGFPVLVAASGGTAVLSYTGITATSFTGCTVLGGYKANGRGVSAAVASAWTLTASAVVTGGAYYERITLGSFIDLIGETGNPTDALLTWSGTDNFVQAGLQMSLIAFVNVMNFYNGSTNGFCFNIVLAGSTDEQFPTMALHQCNGYTFGAGATYAYGAQAEQGSTLYNYGCCFYSDAGAAVYVHNQNSGGTIESSSTFDQCFGDCPSGDGADFADWGSGIPDSYVWSGAAGSLAGSGHDLAYLQVSGTRSTWLMVTPGAYTTVSNTVGAASLTAWPSALPTPKPFARDPRWAGYYGPSDIGIVGYVFPPIPDASSQTVTALRQYYMPIKITRACRAFVAYVGIGSVANGNMLLGVYEDDGTGKPGTKISSASDTAAPTAGGTNGLGGVVLHAISRLLYPGTYWLSAAFDSATVTPICSSMLPLLTPVFYQTLGSLSIPNPATPVALAAGPVPIVTLKTV